MRLHVDATSWRLIKLGDQHRQQLRIDHRRPTAEITHAFVESIRPRLEGRAAAEALEGHLDAIEDRMAAIASRRSRYFWMHVSRRVPPIPLEGASAWTTTLYRRVFALALLKHGGDDGSADMGEDHSGPGWLVPREILYEDLRDIYALEYLAFAFNNAATAYRRVGKGAVLVPEGDLSYGAVADKGLEHRVKLLDQRVARYHELFSGHGSARDASSWTAVNEHGEDHDALLLPSLNVEQHEVPFDLAVRLGMPPKGHGTPNYLPAVFGWRAAADYFAIFAGEIEQIVGVHPDRLMAFFSALSTRVAAEIAEKPRMGIQFFQRGYTVCNAAGLDSMLSELSEFYRYLLQLRSINVGEDEAASDVRRIVDALSYAPHEFSEINLWDAAPSKPVLRGQDFTVWDHASIPHYLWALAGTVSRRDGEIANRKSAAFEREVNAAIATCQHVRPWETGVIVAQDGSKREVDASFIAKGVLYLVECKAFSANPRVERGDFAALKGRWAELDRYLAQAKTLASFLRDHPIGRNYSLPDDVSRIDHCVCTPLAEYVPTDGLDYWFDDETPRICVPRELLEFISGTKPRLADTAGAPS